MSSPSVRYSVILDDAGVTQTLNSIKSSLNSTFANLPGIQALESQFQAAGQQLEALEQSTNALEQTFNGLDSSTSGVNTSLEEIGSAANQAGTDFNTLGTSTQTIEEQLGEIGTTSVTAGQSMSALGGSADTTASSMGALQSNFEGVSGGLTDTNTLFGETTGKMADVGDQAESTGSKMEKIWSKGSGIAIGISATISGIANLIRGFRDYDDAQNKVRKATIALTTQQGKANDAQTAYNTAVAAYGKDSVEAQAAAADLSKELAKLEVKQTDLAIKTKRAGDAQLDVWLGLGGTITGIGGSIIQSLDAIGGEKGFTGLISKMKGALPVAGSLGASLLGLGAAFGIVTGGIALAIVLLQQDTKLMQEFAAQGVKLTTVQQDSNKAFAEMNAITRVTHMTMADVIADPVKAAASYKAMNGAVDANGDIVTTTADQWDSARSPLQILVDTIFGVKPAAADASKGVTDTGTAVQSLDNTVQTHIPTVIKLSSSVRSLGYDTRESYTIGAKALDMYNVEQQKNTTVVNTAYEAFKKLHGGITTTTPAIETANKTVAGSTDVYTAWINKGVDPANEIIKELSKSVMNGVIPQNAIGKAVELAADKMEASGKVTEANREQTILLTTAQLNAKVPVDNLAKEIEKLKTTTGGATTTMKPFISTITALEPGVTAAADAFNIFNEESIKTAQEVNSLHARFAAEVVDLGLVKDATGLTIAQMKLMIDAHNGNRDAIMELNKQHTDWAAKVQEVADKYKTQLNPALVDTPEKLDAITKALEVHAKALEESEKAVSEAHEAFSELFDATKVKDFNKALKEMNLKETLGKDFNDAVKDLGPNIVEFNNAMGDVQSGLQGLIEFGGKVDFNTFSGGLNTWVDSVEALAAADPDAQGEKVKALLESFRTMSPAQIQQHAGSIGAFVKSAKETGDITPKMVTDFLTAFSNENATTIGTTATNTTALGTAAGTAAGPIGVAGTAAGTAATQYDPLQTNILKTATAYDTLVNGIANAVVTFPVPDISPFTTAILTISTGWDTVVAGIQGAKVTVPALIIDTFTKSIDSAYAVFNKMMVGIIQAKYSLAAPNIKPATDAFKSVEVNWKGYANKIQSTIPKITVNNSQALSAISSVISKMNSVKNITRTITIRTVYTGAKSAAKNLPAGGNARNFRSASVGGLGEGEEMAVAPTVGGGMTAVGGGSTGDVNITIINRDEFGTEKVRKFKAVLGKDRYLFGASGSGG